ncbi:MAG TPA: BTAD domain-containing putative transcriptional regulator, partial [Streptosporangiaceae bacterium]
MRFSVLGPLQVMAEDSGEPSTVSAVRLRVLLAVLLWRANQPVLADELAELVWDGAPPAGAPEAVRALVMRLRRRLDPRAAARIVTRAPGYAIEVSGDELDASRFEMLTQHAGAAVRAGQWARAARTAAEALGLWRGTPLADVPSQLLRDQWVPHLDQLHMQVLDWRIEGDLSSGHHKQLIPELRGLTARHPLREHFHSHLMLALYRSGHRAEALGAYRGARDVLVAELGVEPGPQLRDLHQRILSADPALAVIGPAHPPQAEPEQGAPRALPPAVPGFTGRSAELKALSRLLDRPGGHAPGTVVISAIGGTAGVGKTALAVHWAHQVATRFPDGQLYVNLRGYDPDQMVPAADALAGLLRALGVPGPNIPPDPADRAARYRSLVAGRRMLVMLDNARSAEQVRLLLPGTPGCVTVVTSRDSLAGLVARDGAVRLDLDLLPAAEAVSLLRALIGERAMADPVATEELAAQCSRLPLALRVAAELAAGRPAVPLAGLVRELADQQRRLDLLAAAGDSRTAVRSVFSWSYTHLDPAAARMFRLLGLHPGLDLDRYAAAALICATAGQAERLLETLTCAHLTQLTGTGRYGMHDLLRAYARDLASVCDTGDDQQAALTRLFDHYLHTAAAAMDTLFPGERHRRPRIPTPATPVPPVADSAAALAWLDAERATLVAVAAHTTSHGWADHATRLAASLFRYLDSGGHYPEAIAIHSQARLAARHTGDRRAEAEALVNLGVLDLEQGNQPQAVAHMQQGLALFRDTGDRSGKVRALGNIGILYLQLGSYEEATEHLQQALTLCRDIGDQPGEARVLVGLGMIDFRLGRYEQATRRIHRTLALFREVGDRTGEGHALCSLGEVGLRQGDFGQAADHLQQCLTVFREAGSRSGEARALIALGHAALRQGQHGRAADYQRQSLAVCRAIGYQSGEVTALNALGEVFLATGQSSDARVQYATALSGAARNGERYEQAHAHNGLARACQAAGDLGQARRHWDEALSLYLALGAPEADQVRTYLASTADPGGRVTQLSRGCASLPGWADSGNTPVPGALLRAERGGTAGDGRAWARGGAWRRGW